VQQVGKILGKITLPENLNRPADYAVNAGQGALLPYLQENPTFEGDYKTEKAGSMDWVAPATFGVGLSGLGHAGSAVLNKMANGGLPQIKKGQSRLDDGIALAESTLESVLLLETS